ncbi:MAG TPA: hypothetical protein VJI13_03115 [Candidatus Norongarragalinales archaeon]|nr:hypothetical protein [Candidatus Norongarragalinales archaeon]
MELKQWRLEFKPGWDTHFKGFDKSTQQRIMNKFDQMKSPLQGRGLHGSRFKVEEVGGYRIAFIGDEPMQARKIHFVGSHKQYERWYSGRSE